MVQAIVKCTFKPLRNGWYYCNQTEARVKKGGLDAHRRLHETGWTRPPRYIPPPPSLRSVEVSMGSSFAFCPHCDRYTWIGNEKKPVCEFCNTRFAVKRRSYY